MRPAPDPGRANGYGVRRQKPHAEAPLDERPGGVRSFALIERDPDAPISGGFYHWIVYDVPASTRSLGATGAGRTGVSSTGRAAYFGPCPPPGQTHHYVFTLYALDVARAGGSAPLTGQQLEAFVREHTVAHATLAATAAIPPA